MDLLSSILERRRADISSARRRIAQSRLEAEARGMSRRSLRTALAGPGSHVIAEMKRASPSAGKLRDLDAAVQARLYAGAGACAVSVLTEPHWFQGCESDLRAARAATSVPLLRKDFVVDAYQIHEAAAWGADVVLLIVAALERVLLRDLYACGRGLGLDVLAEAHTEAELESAAELPDAVLGVNSRDLRTLRTDLDVPVRLSKCLPPGRPAVAESGVRSRTDVERMEQAGYSGVLVGETLMRAPDPAAKLRELLGAR
jgi:indole-3-glycerol phosphate synthase